MNHEGDQIFGVYHFNSRLDIFLTFMFSYYRCFLNSFPIEIQLSEVSRDKDTDYQPYLILFQSASDSEIEHSDFSAITLNLITGFLGSKTPALLLNQSKVLPFCHFLATTSINQQSSQESQKCSRIRNPFSLLAVSASFNLNNLSMTVSVKGERC